MIRNGLFVDLTKLKLQNPHLLGLLQSPSNVFTCTYALVEFVNARYSQSMWAGVHILLLLWLPLHLTFPCIM